MNKKHLTSIVAFGVIAATSSCSKDGPAGPAGPSYTGAIEGHVSLYDQYGSKVLTGLSSVQIQLNGASAISPDTTGYYIFGKTTTGDYNIAAGASGYAATKVNNFQFLSDTLNRDIKLSAIPNFSPTIFSSYSAVSAPGDSLVINFAADTRARNCIVFINNNSAVGNQPANYLLVYTKAITANQTKTTIVIPAADLYDAGFKSGSTIYCAAYGYVVTDASVYEDLATGKNVYNAVSANPITITTTTP